MKPEANTPSKSTVFLAGQGEMAGRIREHDWSATPLGPPSQWPQSLRSAVSILLPSRAQICLFWGPELITLYNDAYRPTLGVKHPWALGRPACEVWREIWDGVLQPLLEGVMRTGDAFWASDHPFFLERQGYPEETFYDVSYDPVRDESGGVGGVFCIVSETTGRVIGERRLRTLSDLGALANQATTIDVAFREAARVLSANPQDIPFALLFDTNEGSEAVLDDRAGSSLYATGSFSVAGEVSTRAIARWDGSQWNDMAGGLEPTFAVSTTGYALTSFDDGTGTKLIVGGLFTGAAGIVSKNVIAWDGQQWSALPPLLDVASNETQFVNALAVFDDGAGPKLYAAADPNGTAYPFVARLDGASWTVIGILEGYGIRTMHVHDDGIRPALYVGGYFFDNSFKHIVRWSGTAWTGIGSTLENDITTLTSFDDGTGGGSSLYGTSGTQLVRWNGLSWSQIDGKLSDAAKALKVADDGHGPSLFVGGEFTAVGTQQASWGIARLDRIESEDCPSSTGTLYCSDDGSATPCPCGNVGATSHGCGNSWEAAGGLLEAHGQAHVSADRVTLVASDLPPTTTALLFQGTLAVNGGAGAVYGDGLRCAGGSAIRLETHSASGGVATFGWDVADAPISQTGLVPQSGATRFYQVWYRDNQSFCSSDVFNFTNGTRIVWAP